MNTILKIALIGHVITGLVALAFYYALTVSLNRKTPDIGFIRRMSSFGLALLILSWISAGYYYTNYYGQFVRPIIKSGQLPWAHTLLMETKETCRIHKQFATDLARDCAMCFER